MDFWNSFCLVVVVFIGLVNSAVIPDDGDVNEQGLYSKSDHVTVLTQRNFDRKVYGQNHATVVQFYNSYCGHCRAFAPKFKSMAKEIVNWQNIIKLAVLDCSAEENNEICRQFEVMAYPSLRYMHESYVKSNTNVGDRLQVTETSEKLKSQLIAKMQSEQSSGRLRFAPSLKIGYYPSFAGVIRDEPADILYTFVVFENENSTIGSELALDINDYQHVKVKRVYDTNEFAMAAGIRHFPAIAAVQRNLEYTLLTPNDKTKQGFLQAINSYLKMKNYIFPTRDIVHENYENQESEDKPTILNADVVYYSDLEKTLKTSLHTEITRYKILTGEPLQALLDFLEVVITSFPFRGNLKEYITDLRTTLATRSSWGGSEVYELVKRLENTHAPVYVTNLEYVSCRGSQTQYRGYSCGLWSLFHTLTVNAAAKPGSEGPKVLKAMHGYIKNFFGCTDCAQHFQAMAARNRIFDVKENDKAVLWLWISHNEVNLRLAGDQTEDPDYPKIQFPSVARCPECRQARGAWNLPAVYQYLQRVYGASNIRDVRRVRSAAPISPFSNLDIGMLSLLYILIFIILILGIKFLLTKRFYRKRPYKHGRGKV